MANRWIQNAIQKPGSFTKQAKSAGMGVQQFANKVAAPDSNASTTTKKRANLAKTLGGLRGQIKKKKLA